MPASCTAIIIADSTVVIAGSAMPLGSGVMDKSELNAPRQAYRGMQQLYFDIWNLAIPDIEVSLNVNGPESQYRSLRRPTSRSIVFDIDKDLRWRSSVNLRQNV
jgi:hypothetical protein